jgi:hypothetical protein
MGIALTMGVGAQYSPIIGHDGGDGVRMLRPIIAPTIARP